MAEIKTPLGQARGLGSAKHGVGHFIGQRVSAVALLILVCWGFASTPRLAAGGYDAARAWLASPINSALAALLLATALYHARLGMAVIIEDYIARPSSRSALLILNTFVAAAAGALGVISLLKVAFGGNGL